MQRSVLQQRGETMGRLVRDAGLRTGLLGLAWLAWLTPWLVCCVIASGAGVIGLGLRGRVVRANVSHVCASEPVSWYRAWFIALQQITTHWKMILELLRANARPLKLARLQVVGFANLIPYLGRRGIVVVAPHAGPYPILGLLASPWLRRQGFTGEIVVVARIFRPFRSGALMDWFVAVFAQAGVTIIPSDTPRRALALRLRATLASQGIVILFVDEPTPTECQLVPFFDAAIQLPLGPARLVAATKSVIAPCIATFGRSRTVTLTIGPLIEPQSDAKATTLQVAEALEQLIAPHLDQWAMLTPIWHSAPHPGRSLAELHLHTPGSDGLCSVDDWVRAATAAGIDLLAITDHDHLATVRAWQEEAGVDGERVIPGVELTARGRIVHLGVLFFGEAPQQLPSPGTPLINCVRWARAIPDSVVVLVHPLPLLWRWQLRRLARAGALPDAIETRFPLVGWRSQSLEAAAQRYGLATVGGSDGHLVPGQLGRHATSFPGQTRTELLTALRTRTTYPVTRPAGPRPPRALYLFQPLYSWMLPFDRYAEVGRTREWLLQAAQRRQTPTGHALRRPQ